MKDDIRKMLMFLGGLIGLSVLLKKKVVAIPEPIPEPPEEYTGPISYVLLTDGLKKVKVLDTPLPEILSNYTGRITLVELLEVSANFPAPWAIGKVLYYPTAFIFDSPDAFINPNITGIPAMTVACAGTGLQNGYCIAPYNSAQYSNLTLSMIEGMIAPSVAPYIYHFNSPRKLRCTDDPYAPLLNFNPHSTSPGLGTTWFDLGNKIRVITDVGEWISMTEIDFSYT